MDSLTRILALTVKELLAILKDRRSRFIIIGPPVIQMLVFGYAATFDLTDVPYVVRDEDRSSASRELLEGLRGSRQFRPVAELTSDHEIRSHIDAREALLVVRIGPDFERDLRDGRGAAVQILVDGRNSNTARIAANYVGEIISRFNERWRKEHGLRGPSVVLRQRSWFNPNLESRWFIVSGLVGLLTLVVVLLVTSLSVAREREQGTFDQLLVTPFRPAEILAGKAVPGFLIGFGEATIVLLASVYWFGLPLRGSILTFYAGIGVFLLSAVGVGLMISALSTTMQQGLLGGFMFLSPAVILSGFSTPVESMPVAIQWITLLNPLRYMMVILRGVYLEGMPLRLLLDQLWPMALIGVVCMTAAAWLFRNRMY